MSSVFEKKDKAIQGSRIPDHCICRGAYLGVSERGVVSYIIRKKTKNRFTVNFLALLRTPSGPLVGVLKASARNRRIGIYFSQTSKFFLSGI